jgi:predicted ATPase
MSEIGDGKDFYDEGYEDDDRSINNRITFSREKLYGREDTLAILHGLFTRLCEQRNLPTSEETLAAAESPVVILSGYSGAGKSSLVERFIAELDQRKQEGSSKSFLCLSSKFEELQTPDPLSVIAQAFEGLCQSLLQEDQKAVLDRLRVSIEASLGEEANALASIIPDMKQVLGKTEASPLSSSSPSEGGGWNRLQYLFQKLIKALCHDDCPLIMFLDDLQWADSASISLLGALLKDSSLKNFMFIGAVRIEEMDKDHPVSKILSESEQITGKKIERIDLLNLSIHHVEHFIADTLNLEIEECEPLTEFVYGKTRGNVFYAMQVLEELERHKFLYYSMISFQWEWNMEGVDINAGLSENLDDTVASKIQHAPEKMQRALIIASYTRSSFHVQMLHVLMVADGYELPTSELVRLLDMAVLNGFLVNVVGSSTYRFAHDRIQQVAYSMVNGSSRDDLRRMIGTRLFKLVENDEGEDWMMFVAADHLNPCSIHDGGDSLTLARLNLLCGEKANVVAAYVPASIYLQLAIKNLRKCPDHWESNYYLSLRIFRALCDVELCLGNFESGDQLAKEVMDRAQNLQDRLPTFLSLAVAKGRQEQHAAGYQICLQALYDLNAVSRRYHALHVLKDLHIIKRKLKKYSDYDILLLPQLTNERKRSIARFLAEGQLRAYYCGEKNGILAPQQRADLDFALHLLSSMQRNCLQRCPGSRNLTFVVLFVSAMTGDMMGYMFCCLKGLRITLKYGLSAASAYAFAAYGLVLDRVNDHAGAMRMAALAKQVLSRVENTVESKVHKALTLVVISFYIEAWSCPREQILSTGHLAHEVGLPGIAMLIFVSLATF